MDCHGGSLQSVIGNRNVLQDLWDKCLETKLEPDIKGCTRIIRIKHLMGTFDNFYCVNLEGILLKHSDNLSRANLAYACYKYNVPL